MGIGEDLPDLMTLQEVAKFLRVSPLTIRRWGKKGKLPPIRINTRGDRRYTKEAVLRLVGQTISKKTMPSTQTAFTSDESLEDDFNLPSPPKPTF